MSFILPSNILVQPRNEIEKGFLLPGHNYIGPGNPVNNGEPIDQDDLIAQVHDIDYSKAKVKSDIRKADRVAINNFLKDVKRTGNVHSALGAAGLSIKYILESLVGVQYPNISGKHAQTT